MQSKIAELGQQVPINTSVTQLFLEGVERCLDSIEALKKDHCLDPYELEFLAESDKQLRVVLELLTHKKHMEALWQMHKIAQDEWNRWNIMETQRIAAGYYDGLRKPEC